MAGEIALKIPSRKSGTNHFHPYSVVLHLKRTARKARKCTGRDSAISHSEGDLSVPVPRGYKHQMLMHKMPALFRITELNG